MEQLCVMEQFIGLMEQLGVVGQLGVISFIMKEYGKDLSSALIHTKDRRSIVNPNKR